LSEVEQPNKDSHTKVVAENKELLQNETLSQLENTQTLVKADFYQEKTPQTERYLPSLVTSDVFSPGSFFASRSGELGSLGAHSNISMRVIHF
jgi:spore maturation protein CgeB